MSLLATIIGNRRRAFSPRDLAPALWLDASDPTTLLNGSAMATPDQAISQWSDKSGNGRHATQATGVSQPLRKVAIQNGRDVVRFDGVNDGMATSGHINVPYTIFLVSLQRESAIATRVLQSLDKNCVISPTRINYAAFVGFTIRNDPWSSANTWVLTELKAAESSNFVLYSNGAGVTVEGLAAANWARLGIGYTGAAAESSDCDIAEILVFPTALSDADRQMVEAYLNLKYAIY